MPGRPRVAPGRAGRPIGTSAAESGPDASWCTGTSRNQVVSILRQLYAARYPIRWMVPIERFGGSDFRSIEADNTTRVQLPLRRRHDVDGRSTPTGARSTSTRSRTRTSRAAAHIPPGQRARTCAGTPRRPGMIVAGDAVTRAFAARRLGLGRPVVRREGLPALLRVGPVGATQRVPATPNPAPPSPFRGSGGYRDRRSAKRRRSGHCGAA